MARGGGVAAERLKSFIERIERLEEEKAALTSDIREIYSEAKGTGFDTQGHAPDRAPAEAGRCRPPGAAGHPRHL